MLHFNFLLLIKILERQECQKISSFTKKKFGFMSTTETLLERLLSLSENFIKFYVQKSKILTTTL